MNHKIYLKLNTDLSASAKVLSWFEQINQPVISHKQIWWQCQTLLMEGFVNIVEHSHKHLPIETPIEIEVSRTQDYIEIRIWSQGEPFDLEQRLKKTTELEKNIQERGRGLKIMEAIADDLSYEKLADNRYCLLIRKHY
ncbi:Putative Anti-Sigma regulatory factor (Ser/Thr protein kinase) [Trichormus variabilis ATCC 29413]|uniref:Anti-Sigma regulatory factor (Ser/Thr protein kinase) n=2 Tax=Anabaena variabilis TaxID=264691 RepID=Q3MCU8_TRIV2|nr:MULTISPECIES: anti-sigma regulatory factor [Nostocaceae]ABA21188.1 Putative Anti-Sigma regulatory factor (Ser/Thr protein kinase) [Trichormus variabilis ATCC 29413]MBC1214119.1 anti-sigma regulatory factor [Trichormus variabilis ARAD]MBC1257593.1 anti-sigma regulatory factor [Trichormus variabilis V5]MBC1268389.1 anti-sigma regulatory factor [Trichormus variabilis FSR]MBC1304063.1 anti-sigma regulatory factor [Trichormus variabilis N2B]